MTGKTGSTGGARVVLTSGDLRRAQEAIDAATAGITPAQLANQREGRWSPSQILEHLALAYSGTAKGLMRCLEAGRPSASASTLKQRVGVAIVIRAGYMPTGRKAPDRTLPRGVPCEAVIQLARDSLAAMDDALARCEHRFGRRVAVLNHPVLGPLSVDEWRRFHLVHTRHHMKQVARSRSLVR